MLRIILKNLTDLADRSVDAVVGVQENVFAPNLLDDLIPRDKLPSMLDEKNQEFHGRGFEFEYSPGPAQLIRAEIKLEVLPKLETVVGLSLLFHSRPQLQEFWQSTRPGKCIANSRFINYLQAQKKIMRSTASHYCFA